MAGGCRRDPQKPGRLARARPLDPSLARFSVDPPVICPARGPSCLSPCPCLLFCFLSLLSLLPSSAPSLWSSISSPLNQSSSSSSSISFPRSPLPPSFFPLSLWRPSFPSQILSLSSLPKTFPPPAPSLPRLQSPPLTTPSVFDPSPPPLPHVTQRTITIVPQFPVALLRHGWTATTLAC